MNLRVHPQVSVGVGPRDYRVSVLVDAEGVHGKVGVEPRAEVVSWAKVGRVQAGHAGFLGRAGCLYTFARIFRGKYTLFKLLEGGQWASMLRSGLGATIVLLDDNGGPISREEFSKKQRGFHVVKRGQKGSGSQDSSSFRPRRNQRGKSWIKYPPDVVQKMEDQLSNYWSELLGKEIHFSTQEVDYFFMTLPDTALFRNVFLSSFFFEPPVVVDAYAGVGMDSISFLYNLFWDRSINIKRLYTVENDDDPERNQRLIDNVQRWVELKNPKLGDKVEFYLNGTENFFKKCSTFSLHAIKTIHLLYLDPPWRVPDGPNTGIDGEATPSELLGFLFRTIFQHLIDYNIRVKVICIKTRFSWEEVEGFMHLLQMGYHKETFTHCATVKQQPFKGTYYFHMIRTMDPEFGEWRPSKVFEHAYAIQPKITPGPDQGRHRFVHNSDRGSQEIVAFSPERDAERYEMPEGSGEVDRSTYYRPRVRSNVEAILRTLHERVRALEELE